MKKLHKYSIAAVIFVGLAFSPALMRYSSLRPVQSVSATLAARATNSYEQAQTKQANTAAGLPARLKIPKINIDAAIEEVGLTSQGDMDAPKGPTNTGWYKQGPRPGEIGSAVIDGHYGWENRTPAVFDNLNKLHRGDKLYIEDEQGVVITFIVREFRTYGPDDSVPTVFFSNDGKVHLNLITCKGGWNKAQKSYSDRLVVFADKEVE